ncbi:bifunctional nicotinamidase/pyrazinamidase [Myroides guanonis]|uniref:Nicotinamidase n=1 Tax=Myroides guanonis TaxID=1150112 RepID=A0A1I3S4V8_9FLAO|nr:bifunctional nicotinamidase/pyrazinamidase [Myroides guanonis]SFJ52536.1 nicotinamidase/pyrazinamidase [Myroides guanonis]
MKALIVVDLQNDFLPNGALAVTNGDDIIQVINEIQDRFDIVIATQDWHPINHQSFASQHSMKAVFDVIDLNGIQQVLWPNHCVQGTKGADFAKDWNSNCVKAIFRKGTDVHIDSYSGFYDNGVGNETGLTGYLREKKVEEVYVCGLAADFCVFYTARDSFKEGFKTYYLEFATKAISESGYEEAKSIMRDMGVQLLLNKEDLKV